MHPNGTLFKTDVLQSLGCLGTESLLFTFRKMSHVGCLDTFLSAIVDFSGRKDKGEKDHLLIFYRNY